MIPWPINEKGDWKSRLPDLLRLGRMLLATGNHCRDTAGIPRMPGAPDGYRNFGES